VLGRKSHGYKNFALITVVHLTPVQNAFHCFYQVGRLVYELRVANNFHGKAHLANIDDPYIYYGQTAEKFVKYSGLDIQEWILNIMQGDQK